jgi:hypothetical protein
MAGGRSKPEHQAAAYEEKEEKRGRTPICGYWWH